jgi:hypothetical protein
MELVDDIGSADIESGTNGKEDSLFYAMLNGKDIVEAVQTSRGEFTLKFPKSNDMVSISRIAALMRGGIPAAQFDANGEYEIQKCAALDVIVTSGPEWFNKIKRKPDFSWGRVMPDAQFADELYAKAVLFRQRVQTKLNGIKELADNQASEKDTGDIHPNVGDGLFSGASSSVEGN